MPSSGEDSKYRSTKVLFPTVRAEDGHVVVRLKLAEAKIRLDDPGIDLVFEPKIAETLGEEILHAVRKIGK